MSNDDRQPTAYREQLMGDNHVVDYRVRRIATPAGEIAGEPRNGNSARITMFGDELWVTNIKLRPISALSLSLVGGKSTLDRAPSITNRAIRIRLTAESSMRQVELFSDIIAFADINFGSALKLLYLRRAYLLGAS